MLVKFSGKSQQHRLLSPALTPEQALINTLISNVAGAELIDMQGDDVYLTVEQSRKSLFAPNNCGDGTKSIYLHPDAVGSIPNQQLIVVLYSDNKFFFGWEDGQKGTAYPDDLLVEIFNISAFGVTAVINGFLPKQATGNYYAEVNYSAVETDLNHDHAGNLILATNAAASLINMIDGSADTTIRPYLRGMIVSEGAGGVTLTAPAGVLLNGVDGGSFVMTQGQIANWYYNKLTNKYRIK